jgi:hypothetical protein
MTPTVDQFLTKLQANPATAKAFDACSPGLNRREHCQLVLSKVENSCSTIAASKRLADARITHAKLKQDLSAARARLAAAQIKASNSMKPQPPAAPSATTTAAEFSAAKLTILRSEFDKLSPTDARSFLAQNGKILA